MKEGSSRSNVLIVRTAEGIEFPLLIAGPVVRSIAWMLDLAVMGCIYFLVSVLLRAFAIASIEFAVALNILSGFVIMLTYPIACEWLMRGRTLGKWLLRLRVVDSEGMRLSFSQLVVRNILRVVDGIPAVFYLVGGAAAFLNRKSRRLGDIAANTVVIRDPRVYEPDLEQVSGQKYNSFLDYPHVAARLRKNMTPALAGIAIRALLRRELLDPEARVRVFSELADYFRTLADFPAEAVDGLSDEQYVRNVVDTLFRSVRPR